MDRRPARPSHIDRRRAGAILALGLLVAASGAPVAAAGPALTGPLGRIAAAPAVAAAPAPALGPWRGDGPTRTIIDTLTPLGAGPISLLSQNADGVRRSADDGLTWSVPGGLPASGLGSAATSSTLAVLASDPSHAYLVVAGSPPVVSGVSTAAPPGPDPSPGPTATTGASPSPAASPDASPAPSPGAATGPWLYASADAGATWSGVPGDGLAGRIVFSLAAIPHPGATPVLLAADGVDGIVRSTDGGVTFAVATRGIVPDPEAGGIVVNSLAAGSAADVALASTTDGIYRTSDAGATWTRVCATTEALPCGRPSVAPGDPSIVLAAAFRGLSRSTDGGLTWRTAGTDVLPDSEAGGIDSVTIGGGAVPVAWASGPAGLFRSTDGGLTWTAWQGGIAPDEGAGSDRIAADPLDDARAWRVHGLALFTTDDGGRSWSELPGPDALGMTAYAALAGPEGTRLVGADTGVVLRTDRRWEPTIPDTIALDFAEAPAAPAAEIADGADARPTDGGSTDATPDPGAGRDEAPGRLYAATYAAGILRSDDGGATWDDWSLRLPRGPVWDVAAPAALGGRVLAASENGAFVRDAEGDGAWARLGIGLPDAAVRSLVVTDGGDVLAGLETRGVWRLPRGEDAWRRVGLDGRSVLSLAAVRADGRTLLAATDRKGLWRSTDAGRTWKRVATTRASASVAFDPVTATAILATGSAVVASADGGRTWHAASAGLPATDPSAPWRRSVTRVAAAEGGGFVLTTLGGTYLARPVGAP